jgi:predicted nucleic acid-binding protein
MYRSVYDTRFFVEYFYSSDKGVLEKTRKELETMKHKFVSTIVVHELYRLSLEKEGRNAARMRTDLLKSHLKVVDVDVRIATQAAELRHKYRIPMGDSMMAATSQMLKAPCVTDDPHIVGISEVKTRWIR